MCDLSFWKHIGMNVGLPAFRQTLKLPPSGLMTWGGGAALT